MARITSCEKRALGLVSFAHVLLYAAQLSVAGEASPKQDSPPVAGTATAAREDSLMLGFTLTKDSDGELWAHYYIHNRGKSGVLICASMEVSFSVSIADGIARFPLYEATNDFNPMTFFLVDPPPPARAICGSTVLSRRARVSPIFLGELAGLRQLGGDRMKEAKLVGRVEGSVLKWNAARGEYVKIPFDITSAPDAWEKYLHMFTAPIYYQKGIREELKPMLREAGGTGCPAVEEGRQDCRRAIPGLRTSAVCERRRPRGQ